MHYYPFNIGDYRKDTSRLNFIEHGIYRILIDEYYLTEHPLNKDVSLLMRECGVRLPEEIEAFKFIIDKFFVLNDDGYYHYGCDKVLKKIYAKSESARKSVEARWARKNTNVPKSDTNVYVEDTNVHKSDTPEILPNTQYPLPNTQLKPTSSEDDKPAQKIPYETIFDLFTESCVSLPKVLIKDDKRKALIKSIWKMDQQHQDIEFFTWLFNKVESSDFLTGRKTEWKAGFDWVMKPANFKKIVEGNYDNQ